MHVSALLGAHAPPLAPSCHAPLQARDPSLSVNPSVMPGIELVVSFAPFRKQRYRFQLVVSPCPFQAETKCLETQGRVHSTVTSPRSTSKDSHSANESKVFV